MAKRDKRTGRFVKSKSKSIGTKSLGTEGAVEIHRTETPAEVDGYINNVKAMQAFARKARKAGMHFFETEPMSPEDVTL